MTARAERSRLLAASGAVCTQALPGTRCTPRRHDLDCFYGLPEIEDLWASPASAYWWPLLTAEHQT